MLFCISYGKVSISIHISVFNLILGYKPFFWNSTVILYLIYLVYITFVLIIDSVLEKSDNSDFSLSPY